jgi:hypothetical protein
LARNRHLQLPEFIFFGFSDAHAIIRYSFFFSPLFAGCPFAIAIATSV